MKKPILITTTLILCIICSLLTFCNTISTLYKLWKGDIWIPNMIISILLCLISMLLLKDYTKEVKEYN